MLGIAFQQTPLRHTTSTRRIAVGIVVAVIAACVIAVMKAAPVETVTPRTAVAAPIVRFAPITAAAVVLFDDNDPNDTSYLYYYAGMCGVLTRWSYWWYFWDCLNREGIPPSMLVFEDVLYDAQSDGALTIRVRREFSDGYASEFTRQIPKRSAHGPR